MKCLSLLVLSAAGVAIAKGNGSNSTKAQCKQIAKLTKLTELAANETHLASKTDGNTTKIEAIKAKASEAATQLTTLQSNTTLIEACAAIASVEDAVQSCAQMFKLESQAALVANETRLASKTDGNTTKADAIKTKVAANADKLAALQSNTTLAAFCSNLETQATCAAMRSLQKDIDTAANTTKLQSKFDGDTTKISNFQAKVSKAAEKLATLQSNTTLTDICASLKSTTGNAAASSGAASSGAASSGSDKTGDAAAKHAGAMVSLMAVIFASILLL